MVKKNAVMEAGIRTHKGWALGIVTSARGSIDFRGASGLEFQNIPAESSQKSLGIHEISDPTSYSNKADLVVLQERYKGVIDMVGVCALVSMWMDITLYKPEDISLFMGHLTGKDISAAMLMEAGEKIVNIERPSIFFMQASAGQRISPPKNSWK